MNFIEYLKSKKIDPEKFKLAQQDQFVEWLELYNQLHPNSFTQQKLFLINNLRRKYTYEESKEQEQRPTTKMVKPKIKLKPKTR